MAKRKFYYDAGHGWLRVNRAELKSLGIADKISSYSYQKGQYVFLEEDMDSGIFISAHKEKFGDSIELEEIDHGNYSGIRDLEQYEA